MKKSNKKTKLPKFYNGGDFAPSMVVDPNLKSTSPDLMHIGGQSHENGGTPIDSTNQGSYTIEAERGETTDGDFTFSHFLGYKKDGLPTINPKEVATTFADKTKRVEGKFKSKNSDDTIANNTKELEMNRIKSDNKAAITLKEILAQAKAQKNIMKNGGDLPKFLVGGDSGHINADGTVDSFGGSAWSNGNTVTTATSGFKPSFNNPSVLNTASGVASGVTSASNTNMQNGTSGGSFGQANGYAGAAAGAVNMAFGNKLSYDDPNSGVSKGFRASKEVMKATPVGGFVMAGDTMGKGFEKGSDLAYKKENATDNKMEKHKYNAGAKTMNFFKGFLDPEANQETIWNSKHSTGEKIGLSIANFAGFGGIIEAEMRDKENKAKSNFKPKAEYTLNEEGVPVYARNGGNLPRAKNGKGMTAESEYGFGKAMELGMKGYIANQKPEVQKLYQDNSLISKQSLEPNYNPMNMMFNTAASQINTGGPQTRAANLANLYATGLQEQNNYDYQIQNQNKGLATQYEARKQAQNTQNIGYKYAVDDINAKNRGVGETNKLAWLTDVGKGVNNKYEFQSQDRTNRIEYGALNSMYKNFVISPEYSELKKRGLSHEQIIKFKFG